MTLIRTDEYLSCPHCKRVSVLAKCFWTCLDFHLEEHWSDGGVTNKAFRNYAYLCCEHCKCVFELTDNLKLTEEEALQSQDSVIRTIWDEAPLADTFKALESPKLYIGNELNFRLWLWRESNTDYRDNPNTQFSAPRIDNMRVLLTMLEHSGIENETESRAELYRQLGQFKEALATLANSNDNVYTRATRKFSEQQSIEIVKVDPREDHPEPKPKSEVKFDRRPGVYFEEDSSTVIAYPGGCIKTILPDGSRNIRSKRGHEMEIDHLGEVGYRTIHA